MSYNIYNAPSSSNQRPIVDNGQAIVDISNAINSEIAAAGSAARKQALFDANNRNFEYLLAKNSAPSVLGNSPLIPKAAHAIAATVQALANLQICVYDADGILHRGSIVIAGNQAILSVHL